MNYKVGDKVRIKRRTHESGWYPFTFIEDMAAYSGQIFTISEIRTAIDQRCDCNGDFHFYLLEEDEDRFRWHSTMFEKVEDTVIQTKVSGSEAKRYIPEEEPIKIIL